MKERLKEFGADMIAPYLSAFVELGNRNLALCYMLIVIGVYLATEHAFQYAETPMEAVELFAIMISSLFFIAYGCVTTTAIEFKKLIEESPIEGFTVASPLKRLTDTIKGTCRSLAFWLFIHSGMLVAFLVVSVLMPENVSTIEVGSEEYIQSKQNQSLIGIYVQTLGVYLVCGMFACLSMYDKVKVASKKLQSLPTNSAAIIPSIVAYALQSFDVPVMVTVSLFSGLFICWGSMNAVRTSYNQIVKHYGFQ